MSLVIFFAPKSTLSDRRQNVNFSIFLLIVDYMFPYPFTFYLPLFLHFKLFYMWVIHSWVTVFIYFIYFYLFCFLISVFRLFIFNINMSLYVTVAFYYLFYVCSFFPLSKYLSVYFDYFVVYLYCFVYLTILTIFILFYLFMFLCLSVSCFAISLYRCCSCCSSLSWGTRVSHETAVIPLLEWSQKNFETHSCGCWHHRLLEGGPQSLVIWDSL